LDDSVAKRQQTPQDKIRMVEGGGVSRFCRKARLTRNAEGYSKAVERELQGGQARVHEADECKCGSV
jgi:hypothetical protein